MSWRKTRAYSGYVSYVECARRLREFRARRRDFERIADGKNRARVLCCGTNQVPAEKHGLTPESIGGVERGAASTLGHVLGEGVGDIEFARVRVDVRDGTSRTGFAEFDVGFVRDSCGGPEVFGECGGVGDDDIATESTAVDIRRAGGI